MTKDELVGGQVSELNPLDHERKKQTDGAFDVILGIGLELYGHGRLLHSNISLSPPWKIQ